MDMPADPQFLTDSLVAVRTWLAREFSSPSIVMQSAAIAAAGVSAWLAAPRLQRWTRTWHRRFDSGSRLGQTANAFVRRFTLALILVIPFLVALVLLWPALLLALRVGWPHQAIRLAVALLAAWVLIRLTSSLVGDRFWAGAIAVVVWFIAALSILGILDDTAAFLQGLNWRVGGLRISPLEIVAGLLWLAFLLWIAAWAARMLEARVISAPGRRRRCSYWRRGC